MPDPRPPSLPRRMLAVAFGPRTMAAALAGLPRLTEQADCLELRLDLFDEPFDLAALLRARGPIPAVITLRPPDQGGRSPLSAAERLAVLCQAADSGAEYVDLEFDVATPEAISELHVAGAQVIVSRHDFAGMPRLADWWSDLADLGADIVKVVGTANRPLDNLEVCRAFAVARQPTIAIAMGSAGLPTRILALRDPHCFLTYAALDAETSTAPGQITAAEMRSVYRAERLGPATRVYGLLGPHVETDRLTDYNAWFTADRLDAVAVPFVSETDTDTAAVVDGYRELPVSGWHIHGQRRQSDVLRVLDGLSRKATAAGRANAVVRQVDGTLHGDLVTSPREQYDLWRAAL